MLQGTDVTTAETAPPGQGAMRCRRRLTLPDRRLISGPCPRSPTTITSAAAATAWLEIFWGASRRVAVDQRTLAPTLRLAIVQR
jgi:hypothetical protein